MTNREKELKPFVGSRVIHRSTTPLRFADNQWHYKIDDRDVVLMSVVGTWCMVRRPRCVPYICKADEIII